MAVENNLKSQLDIIKELGAKQSTVNGWFKEKERKKEREKERKKEKITLTTNINQQPTNKYTNKQQIYIHTSEQQVLTNKQIYMHAKQKK